MQNCNREQATKCKVCSRVPLEGSWVPKMPYKCCIPFCKGNYDKRHKVSTFKFPKEEEKIQKWLQAIQRKDFYPTKCSRVCEKHFVPQYIETAAGFLDRKNGRYIVGELLYPRLHKDAVPTIFPGYPKSELNNSSNETLILNNTVRIKQEIDEDSISGNEEIFIPPQPVRKVIQDCFSKYSNVQAELSCTDGSGNLNTSNSADNEMKRLSEKRLTAEDEEMSNFEKEHEDLPLKTIGVIQDCFSNYSNVCAFNSSDIEMKKLSQKQTAPKEEISNFVNEHQSLSIPSVSEFTSFDLLGKKWAEKMKSLEKSQRVFAEKLINNVFFLAELKQLGHGCEIISTNSIES